MLIDLSDKRTLCMGIHSRAAPDIVSLKEISTKSSILSSDVSIISPLSFNSDISCSVLPWIVVGGLAEATGVAEGAAVVFSTSTTSIEEAIVLYEFFVGRCVEEELVER